MMFFLLCLDAVVAITMAVESAPPLPEKVRFKVASTQCFFSVDRQRASTKVVSTSIWKASAKYLHSLEAAAVNWPEVLRQKYGEDWNLRVYVDKSIYKLVEPTKHTLVQDYSGAILKRFDEEKTLYDYHALRDILLRNAKVHKNFELWTVESCPPLVGRAMDDMSSFESLGGTRMSMLRFHPFFDPAVEVAVVRNFEQLTSAHDFRHTEAWLRTGKQYSLYTFANGGYNGNYPFDTKPWETKTREEASLDLVEDLEPMWRMNEQAEMNMSVLIPSVKASLKRRQVICAAFVNVRGTLPAFMWDIMWEGARRVQQKSIGTYGVDEIGLTLALKYIPQGWEEHRARNPASTLKEFLAQVVGPAVNPGAEELPTFSSATVHVTPLVDTFAQVIDYASAPVYWKMVEMMPEPPPPSSTPLGPVEAFEVQRSLLKSQSKFYKSPEFEFVTGLPLGEAVALIETRWSTWNRFCHLHWPSFTGDEAFRPSPNYAVTWNSLASQIKTSLMIDEGDRPWNFIKLATILLMHRYCRPMQVEVLDLLMRSTCPKDCDAYMKYRSLISEWIGQSFMEPVPTRMNDWASLGLFMQEHSTSSHPSDEVDSATWFHALLTEFAVWTLDGPGLVAKSKNGFMDIKRSYGLLLGLTEEEPLTCACDIR